MGIIFSDKARHVQVKSLLGTPQGKLILSRLSAGRDGGDKLGFGSAPHRLSPEELEKLKDEWIYFESDGDCWYANFERPTDEIRAVLGLEPQDMLGNPLPKEESLEESKLEEDRVFVGKLKEYFELPPEIHLLPQAEVENLVGNLEPEETFRVGYINPVYIYKELWDLLPIFKCTEMDGYTGVDFSQSEDSLWKDKDQRVQLAKDQIKTANDTKNQVDVGASVEYVKQDDKVYQNKLVQQKDAATKETKEILSQRHTILFYPTGNTKVIYYVKLPERTDWLRVDEQRLEHYIYDNMDKIENKLKVKDPMKRKTKVYQTLYGQTVQDIDRDTRSNTDYADQKKMIYKYERIKNTVRSLYTTQLYYLSYFNTSTLGNKTLGETIVESLDEKLERNPFDLLFENINAYGEILTEDKDEVCCICGEPLNGYGNNPAPYKKSGLCCDACNMKFVIPARLAQIKNSDEEE